MDRLISENEDCVRRANLISKLEILERRYGSDFYWETRKIVDKLPSVKPQEPKTGHWEWVPYDYNPKLGDWHCSECRCVVVECVDKNEKGGIPLYKYCPQCGTKMVEPQESEALEYDRDQYNKGYGDGLNADKWIPVSEKLPEKNVEVLATTEWGAVTIAEMYSANDWFIHEGTTNAEADEIVAWMPLPKPFKPQESEG